MDESDLIAAAAVVNAKSSVGAWDSCDVDGWLNETFRRIDKTTIARPYSPAALVRVGEGYHSLLFAPMMARGKRSECKSV